MINFDDYDVFCRLLNMHLEIKSSSKDLRKVAMRVESKIPELKRIVGDVNELD